MKIIPSVVATLITIVPALGAVDITWGFSMIQTQTVSSDDEPVRLVWTSFHNVLKFPNKAAYEACDFSLAEEICQAAEGGECELPNLSSGNTYYYGCSVGTHCLGSGQKLALTVSKPSSGGGGRGIFNLCN